MEVLAASHIHSTWSYDGSWSLEALSERFRRRGYRVLLMTEHDRGFTQEHFQKYREACDRASSKEILLVPGIEYSDSANRVHVLVWGTPFLGEGLPTGEMLEAARAADGVAVLAHPTRKSAWSLVEPHWTERLLGIEAWNRKYDGWAPSITAPALLAACAAMPFVGLDFHTERQGFPLGMALDIPCAVAEVSVLECLRSRRCEPRAFGLPLQERLFRKAVPALGFAEHTRRAAASFVKYSRSLAR